jgi:hypothetical protein
LSTENLEIQLKPWQRGFLFSEKRFPAIIGAWAVGKTFMGILKMVGLAETYPDNLLMIVRKNFTDMRDSLIKDFEQYTGMHVEDGEKKCVFPNGSQILFRHADTGREKHASYLQNVNLGGFLIEQAEELGNARVFTTLLGRMRRGPDRQHRCGAVIANAYGHNWVWENWINHPGPENDCYQAKTFDNADVLPKSFIADLEIVRKLDPQQYARNVMNDHEADTGMRFLIAENMIEEAEQLYKDGYIHDEEEDLKRTISIDPALEGDKIILNLFENHDLIETEALPPDRDSFKSAARAYVWGKQKNCNHFTVDAINVGDGLANKLEELGGDVLRIMSQSKSFEEKFMNLRAEMWWKAAEKFINKQVRMKVAPPKLKKQITSVGFDVKSNGKIFIEDKKVVKARLGESPDWADAFVMGLWGVDQAPIVERRRPLDDFRRSYKRGAAGMTTAMAA